MAAGSKVPKRVAYADAVAASGLPATTKAICLLISESANPESGRAWPSRAMLARRIGLTPGAISGHTSKAEAEGYLFKQRRRNGTVRYTLTIPTPSGPLWGLPSPTQRAVPQADKWAGYQPSYEGW
ncbi:helix-turn-helix domain-containing protein [Paenarthrobacter sp. 4246]|uniref:helix-turn-helix domain-containing protein n=1 Tax=Paenarthrobacter sp. 4246 TaxID=3156456 RepID=UPI00339868B3